MGKGGFDAFKEVTHIVDHIRHYFATNGTVDTKAVIGISGGKDSTIATALLVRALGKDRVIGVMMPQNHQADLDDSYKVCETLGIKHYVINIGPVCDELYKDFVHNTQLTLTPQIETNAPARIRMNILYMVAAAVGGRVINTGNASEAYVGYTTKYGDLAGDYAVLRDYYVEEVYALGDAMMELPSELVHKDPADGMSGKTDEDNMGFTYAVLDDYLIRGITPPADVLNNIMNRHLRNKHKEAINLPHPCARTRPYVYHNDGFEF
jgi:NAD+ synthase